MEVDKKIIEDVLEELRWARMTIKNKLKFGLPEDIAIKSRERRVNGVLITAIKKLENL